MFRSTRKTLIRVGEAFAAVGAVLLFFLVFMAVIGLIFPEGTALRSLVFSGADDDTQITASRIDLETTDPSSFIAVLSQTERSVKNKRADAIAWSNAEAGMPLGERHSVQTLSRSGAVISFDGDDRLVLDENSLVVIRSMTRHARQNRKRTSVVALEGKLRGVVQASDLESEEMELEVVTASGTTRIRSDEEQAAEFAVSVNPDDTSTFTVHSGTAEVTSAGKTVTLGPNQTLTVARSEAPGSPVSLPTIPMLASPRDGAEMTYRSTAPAVRFAWGGETDSYRLEIGRDPEFHEIVYDEQIQQSEFVHGNLPAGRLFWRVTALAGWAQGPTGPPRRLELIQDTEAPELQVRFPEGRVSASGAVLHGIAEPGARVFVSDQDVSIAETGSFEYALNLDPGMNLVVVEAIDDAGNVSYRSKLIEAEHERSSR